MFFAATSSHMKYSFKKLQKEINWWNKSRNLSDRLTRLLHIETFTPPDLPNNFFFSLSLSLSTVKASPFDLLSSVFRGSHNHRQMESLREKRIIGVVLIVPPLSAPALVSTGYSLRPQTTRRSMRATAAIAISLIPHCIPQKVTGMEAEASGEEAAVAISMSGYREKAL